MIKEETYTSMYSRNAELYHHGIQGQKWGVQNGPPYPLDSDVSTGKRLKKASKILVKDAKKDVNNTKIGKIERWTGPLVSLAVLLIDKEAKKEYTDAVIAYRDAKESKKHFKTLYKALEKEKFSNIDSYEEWYNSATSDISIDSWRNKIQSMSIFETIDSMKYEIEIWKENAE